MISVITVEGVLKSIVGDNPIQTGIGLYHSLCESHRVFLITDDEPKRTAHWLKLNGLTRHMRLIGTDVTDPLEDAAKRRAQLAMIRAEGEPIAFVVDPNPAVAKSLLLAGLPTLLFVHPQYSRPSFRPDYQGRVIPWAELAAEVERQQLLRNSDNRFKGDEE